MGPPVELVNDLSHICHHKKINRLEKKISNISPMCDSFKFYTTVSITKQAKIQNESIR